MRNLPILLLSVGWIAIQACAGTGDIPELSRYKTIYDREMARLATKIQSQRLHVPQDHIKALRKLEEEYQKSGELIKLLAVRRERERFIGDPRADHINMVDTPLKLRELQKSYIANYKAILNKRRIEKESIRDNYIGVLEKLQKKLTQQGEIEKALVIMKEVKAVESGSTTSSSASAGNSGITDGSNSSTNGSSIHKGNTIDAKVLATILHGEIVRWNSYNNEITIKYDFSDDKQLLDWKGGKIKGIRGRLTCNRTVSWLKIQLSDIKRVEIGMLMTRGSKHAGFVIGNNIRAEIVKGRTIDGKIYHTGNSNPIVKIINIEEDYGQPFNSIITINERQVSWSVNGGRIRHGVLDETITYPQFIGVGNMMDASSYDSVTVTGTLSTKMVERIKRKLGKN